MSEPAPGAELATFLRQPAGATFWAETLEERLQFWKMYLARSLDPSAVSPVERALRELLTPLADQDRGGWTLGGFRVRIPTGGTFVGGGRRLELTGRAS